MTQLTQLPGLGSQLAKKLEKAGIVSPLDLLFHLPRTYQDRTRLYPLSHLKIGSHVLVRGKVVKSEIVTTRRRMLLCHIADQHGYLLLRFFHFYPQQAQQLHEGASIQCFGEVRQGPQSLEMVHPQYHILKDQQTPILSDRLTPVYPAIEGISQAKLRQWIQHILSNLHRQAPLELIPQNLLQQYHIPNLEDALETVHQPTPDTDQTALQNGHHPAQQRLALEKLTAHRLALRQRRQQQRQVPAPALTCTDLKATLLAQLPFALTAAQQHVITEIETDLKHPKAMMRLVQGDVGCGKTVVALIALLQAVASGKQAAIMAPTEILAEQHYQNFKNYLEPLNICVTWLASKLTAKQRRDTLNALVEGKTQVIVGTHALFQEDVPYYDLGLVVIDEQHRFGVAQRLALQKKGEQQDQLPHQLIMTATPIPRTLAMTVYADLDVSIIDKLPPGRTPVNTILINNQRRDEVIQRIRQTCLNGQQVYWVCTLIEESEALSAQAAQGAFAQLQQELPGLTIGLVHGRMKPTEKQQIMQAFQANHIQLLVATTVIEVGVDIPNASVMVIENAERLGLSQLHQLRGRVGRGSQASHCVLLYQSPLSQRSRQRLQIIRQTTNGFKLAEADLQMRGPGEVMGTKQTGEMGLRIANLARDQGLLPQAQHLADALLTAHPQATKALIQRWLGDKVSYQFA